MVWSEEHFFLRAEKKMIFGTFPGLAQLLGKCRGPPHLGRVLAAALENKNTGHLHIQEAEVFYGYSHQKQTKTGFWTISTGSHLPGQ